MRDLLDFGRPSRPDFTECLMEEVVEAAVSACAPLARRKSVQIVWPRGTASYPVLADRARVTQVLQNLIENAVHFSPEGSRVEVALGAAGDREERQVECAVGTRAFDPPTSPPLQAVLHPAPRGGLTSRSSSGSSTTTEEVVENHASGAAGEVRLRAVRS
jgi:signal transduction histidine kinase